MVTYVENGSGKAIVKNYKLNQTSTNASFSVNYEVDIIEESKNQIKVKAYNYYSDDQIANNSKIRTSIISFMNNKWVEKNDCEIIFDNQQSRNLKLNKLLNND